MSLMPRTKVGRAVGLKSTDLGPPISTHHLVSLVQDVPVDRVNGLGGCGEGFHDEL